MKYRPEIDGLRALAVLPVILFHAGFSIFSGGFVGVDIFFVISGYLISSIIIRELDEDRFSIVNFYERRARRILPALFFVIFLCLPVTWFWLAPADFASFGKSLFGVSIFSSNIMFWKESGYFTQAAELKPLLHTWSLAVEEQYYVFFPIFLMLFWRFKMNLVLILLVIGFFASIFFSHWASLVAPSFNFYLLPSRAWELLLGVFSAIYLRYSGSPQNSIISQGLSLLGLVFILTSIFVFDDHTRFPSFYALLPTLGAVLLIIWAVPGTATNHLLSIKFFAGVGLISYSAYLWHQPLLAFARHRLDAPPTALMLCLSIASLLIAYISWRWVEGPFRDKNFFSRQQIFTSSLIASFFVGIIGLGIWGSKGAVFRFSAEDQKILTNFQSPGKYTSKRHNSLILAEFHPLSEIKILIIGDSFAQDLTNAVFESQSDKVNLNKLSVSTYYISGKCGVLFIPPESLPIEDLKDENNCRKSPNFHSSSILLERIEEADRIWVASAWKDTQFPFMRESIENIKSFNSNVVIFGSKNFGTIKESQFMFEGGLSAWEMSRPMRQTHISLNEKLAKEIPNHTTFVNVSQRICKSSSHCRNSDGVDVFSYDGGHLTPYGANYVGGVLFGNSSLLNN